MKPIILPVLCHDDTSKSLQDLGIKYNLNECDTKNVAFYNINCVTPYAEGDFEGTQIFAGSTIFVSPLKYENVVKYINETGA